MHFNYLANRMVFAIVTIAFSTIFLLFSPHIVRAAEITVTTTTDDFTTNGNCTLREAIQSINIGGTVDGCVDSSPNGFGSSDTIILGPGFHTLSVPQDATSAAVHNESGDLNIRDAPTTSTPKLPMLSTSASTLRRQPTVLTRIPLLDHGLGSW